MKPLLVANWKTHKTIAEASNYAKQTAQQLNELTNIEVVICPPLTSLSTLQLLLHNTNLKLGAQNVSAWPEGAHTGEVSASLLEHHCQYVIIGHSERRAMGETLAQINDKIRQSLAYQLQPIVCISNEQEVQALTELNGQTKWIIAFEPIEAIGSGQPEDPKVVEQMIATIKQHLGNDAAIIYGGSVKADNITQYIPLCQGALIGGASLDPQEFSQICRLING